MELFKIHPYDFIIKPIDKEKVINNVSKLLELDEQDNNYFVYEYNRIKIKFIMEILCILKATESI